MAELDSTLLDMSPDRINDQTIIQVKMISQTTKGELIATDEQQNQVPTNAQLYTSNASIGTPEYVEESAFQNGTSLQAKKPVKITTMTDARSASGFVGGRSNQSMKPSDNDAASYLPTKQEITRQKLDQRKQKGKPPSTSQGSRATLPVKVADMNSMVQIRKKQPTKTFREKQAYKAEKQRQIYQDRLVRQGQPPQRQDKVLDGFLLLFSCNKKLPHEAVISKLPSQQITDVRDEDLAYFKNLISLDLSDNRVNLEWLKNLEAIEEIDLQYNQINSL